MAANRSAVFSKPRGLVFIGLVLLFGTIQFANADTPASPFPTGSPDATTPAAAPPPIPKGFDPCGGFLELLNKIGNGTACVFVRGEGAITGQYVSTTIPAYTQLTLNRAGRSYAFERSSQASGFGYPASTVYIGVLPRAQIAITPPSFVQVNSGQTGNLIAAGASNMKFEYKQLAYVNLQKFTLIAIDLTYQASTGSPGFAGPGPSYTINPILTQPLPHNYGVTLAFPVNNVTLSNSPICSTASGMPACVSGGTQRGWNWAPQLVPYWTSPGGTLLALFVQHNFHPNVTPLGVSASQLIGRHFELSAAYGGFSYSVSANGPFSALVNAAVATHPRLFTFSGSYLIGRSDLPAALQQ